MTRKLLLLFLALAACSKGPQADLQYIGDARSVAAEWALVNQHAAAGKLTSAYVATMHQWIRQQVDTDLKALTVPTSDYAAEIASLLKQPDDASPAALRAVADRLKRQEDALESA